MCVIQTHCTAGSFTNDGIPGRTRIPASGRNASTASAPIAAASWTYRDYVGLAVRSAGPAGIKGTWSCGRCSFMKMAAIKLREHAVAAEFYRSSLAVKPAECLHGALLGGWKCS